MDQSIKDRLLLIDFDDTIHDTKNFEHPYRMGKPEPGAVAAVTRLKQMGYVIVIFTGRPVDDPRVKKAVADWLDYFRVPYDDITNVKPNGYHLLIDDKAIHYESWQRVLLKVNQLRHPIPYETYTQELTN